MNTLTNRPAPRALPAPLALRSKISCITAALTDKKADNVLTLPLTNHGAADAFVVATALNERHASALADAVGEALHKTGERVYAVEGSPANQWVLADCGDVIVHIFLAHTRAAYNLEKLWSPVFDDDDTPENNGAEIKSA